MPRTRMLLRYADSCRNWKSSKPKSKSRLLVSVFVIAYRVVVFIYVHILTFVLNINKL